MPWLPQLVTHGRDSQHSGVPRALLCIMGTQASGGDQPWQPVSSVRVLCAGQVSLCTCTEGTGSSSGGGLSCTVWDA